MKEGGRERREKKEGGKEGGREGWARSDQDQEESTLLKKENLAAGKDEEGFVGWSHVLKIKE